VKVTLVPEQITLEGLADMVTLAATLGFIVIVIEFDVAGLPVTQVAFEVITHVITSPLANPAVVYVVLFVPTIVVPFFH
jgi:hypothetical protein